MTPSDQRTTINGHSAMMALLTSIDQWSKGPVNQLVHDQFQSPERTKTVQNQQSDSRP